MTDLDKLKFNLQEKQFPYFQDEELTYLLEAHGSVLAASYEGCIIKSQDDSVKLGPIDTPSNEKYWLRMARHYLAMSNKEKRLAAHSSSSNTWKRADGR